MIDGTPGFEFCFDVDAAALSASAAANLAHGVKMLDASRVAALFATAVTVDVRRIRTRTVYSRTGDVVAWGGLVVAAWTGLSAWRRPRRDARAGTAPRV